MVLGEAVSKEDLQEKIQVRLCFSSMRPFEWGKDLFISVPIPWSLRRPPKPGSRLCRHGWIARARPPQCLRLCQAMTSFVIAASSFCCSIFVRVDLWWRPWEEHQLLLHQRGPLWLEMLCGIWLTCVRSLSNPMKSPIHLPRSRTLLPLSQVILLVCARPVQCPTKRMLLGKQFQQPQCLLPGVKPWSPRV